MYVLSSDYLMQVEACLAHSKSIDLEDAVQAHPTP